MKRTALIICLLHGVVLGLLIWHDHSAAQDRARAESAALAADSPQEKAAGGKAAAETAGEKPVGFAVALNDTRIAAVIKAKYFVDQELSALAISVECHDGRVVLTGSAASPALVRRAVEVARKSGGVRNVSSRLNVKN